jgi:protocatechuate 3,4-dioxygenase beta subunit
MKAVSRRGAIRVRGVVFASGGMAALARILTGCGGGSSGTSSTTGSGSGSGGGTTSSSSCVAATNVTRGPYFVDDRADSNIANDDVDATILERSDIRSDSKGSTGTQAGLPLTLAISVANYSSGACTPISGAQVHIWHCNALGAYSDIQAPTNDNGANLTSENFLRGYQFTDSNGVVTFTTIYPGWYSGRAVHIHVKVRIFDSTGKVTTEATTQLFFDDRTSSAVYAANSAYKNGTRDVLNTADGIYASESPALLVSLTGSATTSYAGVVSIGITEGSIFGG